MKRFLLLIHLDQEQIKRIDLEEGAITLGSAQDNDVILDDLDIAPRHLRLTPSEEGVTVESVEGSTFHFAGGDINSGLLSPGESMQVGPFTIKCEIADHHAFHEEEGEEDSEEPDFLEEFASKEDHWEDQELFNPSGENKSQFHTIKADLLEEGSFEIHEEPSEQSRQFE